MAPWLMTLAACAAVLQPGYRPPARVPFYVRLGFLEKSERATRRACTRPIRMSDTLIHVKCLFETICDWGAFCLSSSHAISNSIRRRRAAAARSCRDRMSAASSVAIASTCAVIGASSRDSRRPPCVRLAARVACGCRRAGRLRRLAARTPRYVVRYRGCPVRCPRRKGPYRVVRLARAIVSYRALGCPSRRLSRLTR